MFAAVLVQPTGGPGGSLFVLASKASGDQTARMKALASEALESWKEAGHPGWSVTQADSDTLLGQLEEFQVAVLCCAVLCCAVLCCAVLCCAVLCCAVLCCAVLCCAVLCCAQSLLICCCACPRFPERLELFLLRRMLHTCQTHHANHAKGISPMLQPNFGLISKVLLCRAM